MMGLPSVQTEKSLDLCFVRNLKSSLEIPKKSEAISLLHSLKCVFGKLLSVKKDKRIGTVNKVNDLKTRTQVQHLEEN